MYTIHKHIYSIDSNEIHFLTKNDSQANVFVTGSRAWNQATSDSDVDICINASTCDLIFSELGLRGFKIDPTAPKGSLGSIMLYKDGIPTNINLIQLKSDEFEIWRIATQLMTLLFENINIKPPKLVRCSIFETLRAVVKLLKSFTKA